MSSRNRARARRLRRREPYAWLQAGAVALGVGAAMAGGTGNAQADATNTPGTAPSHTHSAPTRHHKAAPTASEPTQATTQAPPQNKRPSPGTGNYRPDPKPQRAPVMPTLSPATTTAAVSPAISSPAPTAATPVASVVSTRTVTSRSVPVPNNPMLKIIAGVLSVFQLNSAEPPTNPLGALLWGAFRQVETFVGLVPRRGTVTTTSDPANGAVAGKVAFSVPAKLPLAYLVSGEPTNGTVTVSSSGVYTYTPTALARYQASVGGPVTDTFTVLAGDGIATTKRTITVSILAQPDTPTTPTSASQNSTTGGIVVGTLIATDPAGKTLSYNAAGNPTHGTVSVTSSGVYTYTPTVDAQIAAGLGGPTTDSFTVTATNGTFTSTAGTITVPIVAVSDVPTTPTSTSQNTDFLSGIVTGTLSSTDPGGKSLTYNVVSHSTGTTVSVTAAGAYTYTPSLQSQYLATVGGPTTDTFTVTATNGIWTSAEGTITVPIVKIADTPLAPVSGTQTTDPVTGKVTGVLTAVDPAGVALTYALDHQGTYGTVTVASDGSFIYTPTDAARAQAAAGGPTTDTFTARASNSTWAGAIGTITVSIAPPPTPTVINTYAAGSTLFQAALNPSGTTLYVTNLITNGTVTVLDPSSGVILGHISVGNQPRGLAVSPDGSTLYVANGNSNSVSVINTATNTITATIGVGILPQQVAVSPDGTTVYVTNSQTNSVSIINTATNTVATTIAVGSYPTGVAFTPDGTHAYVTSYSGGSVSVIDTATATVTKTISTGTYAAALAVSPDGTRVYVTDYYSNTVAVVDTATGTVTATIPTGGVRANGVAFSPDGKTAYVTNYGGTVSVIDTATNLVTSSVTVGIYTTFPAVDHNTGLVYVPSLGDGTISVISPTG